MMLIPRHSVLRLVAAAWLLASVVLIAVTLLRPEIQANDRATLSTLVPLYFLSLPLGHLCMLAINKGKLALFLEFDNFVPNILGEGLILWSALTGLGYLQWFLLLP